MCVPCLEPIPAKCFESRGKSVVLQVGFGEFIHKVSLGTRHMYT